jgi:hypothetical protein
MKRPRFLAKVIALASSVALVTAAIAGVFDPLLFRDPKPAALSGTKSRVFSAHTLDEPDRIEPRDAGSEYHLELQLNPEPATGADQSAPTLMNGTKLRVFTPFRRTPGVSPSATPNAATTR